MRISRADADLWRAGEMQGLRRPVQVASPAAPENRREPSLRLSTDSRRRLIGRLDSVGSIAPLDGPLTDTAGNVLILRHLINTILPTMPMPEDVRLLAASLFTEDMNHHLRVLDTGFEQDAEPDA